MRFMIYQWSKQAWTVFKRLFFRWAPRSWQHAAKKAFFPKWIRENAETAWGPAAAVRRLLAEGDRVIDAGANVGYVTYILSRYVGPSGRVYSLEPVPETFDLLRSNLRRLGVGNAEALPYALSSETGPARMEVPFFPDGTRNYYETRIVHGAPDPRMRAVTVTLKRLDDLFPESAPSVALIKIDCEGYEGEVVRGGLGLIRRDRPILLIEAQGDPDQPDSTAERLFRLLHQENYRPLLFSGERWALRQPGQTAVDYFFFPSEKTASVGVPM